MKTCNECGTVMSDDAMFCPKCGAPQPRKVAPAPPVSNPTPNTNYVRVAPANQNVWDSPLFSILPFVAAILFLLGTLIFLILVIEIHEGGLIFCGILFFLGAIANLIVTLPKLIKMASK